MKLFRKEVIKQQSNRLYGDVTLATPISTWYITGIIATIIFGIFIILFMGSYARKENVLGWLRPDKGLVKIIAPQLGVIKEIHSVEGQIVKENQALVTVNFDTFFSIPSVNGKKTIEFALKELQNQINERKNLIQLSNDKFIHNIKNTKDQILSSKSELIKIVDQKKLLKQRINSSKEVLDRYEKLAQEEAASFLEVERQRENVLALRQVFAQIGQQIDIKKGEIVNYQNRLDFLPLEQQTTLAELQEIISKLRSQKTQLSRQGTLVITAPIAGRIASLPVTKGVTIRQQDMIVAILPERGNLEAELFVPTRAAGFIREGQNVRIQFDAFPFQKFGVSIGKISSISKTIFEPKELPVAIGVGELVYLVKVTLPKQKINAYGESFPLQAGMTLRADIILEKRKLWEVILEPLLVRLH